MSCAAATDLHDYELRELAERVAPVLDAVRRRGDQALMGDGRRGAGALGRRGAGALGRGGVGALVRGGVGALVRMGDEELGRRGDEALGRGRDGALGRRGNGARVPGDQAFPGVPLRLSVRDIDRCVQALPARVVDDLRLAHDQMRRFAEAHRAGITDSETEAMPGVRCGVRHVAVASAGVCLPAEPDGLSLQAAQAATIAARAAGVERVVACVPAAGLDARRPSALLVGALALAGAHELYLTAGVRALAALAFGTESIPRVEAVIAANGDDDAMAEAARQLAATGTGRLRPGILILADDDADPEIVAADLISCGPRSRGVLITTSPVLAARVSGAVERQLDLLPRGDEAARAWYERGTISLAADPHAACRLADRHGLECVQVMTGDPRWYLNRLRRCRHVVMGESAGAAPAGGGEIGAGAAPAGGGEIGARGGTSVATFLRAISYREGHADDYGALARLRRLTGLEAQARACEARADRRTPAFAALTDN